VVSRMNQATSFTVSTLASALLCACERPVLSGGDLHLEVCTSILQA
jgi:hypothetical protein